MRTIHVLQVACAILASTAHSFALSYPPSAPYALPVAAGATSLLMALGLASGPVGATLNAVAPVAVDAPVAKTVPLNPPVLRWTGKVWAADAEPAPEVKS